MAASDLHNSNDPLLGKSANQNNVGLQPISSTSQTALKALAWIRVVTGAACIVAPTFTCAMFKYTVPAESTLLVRLFGIRDGILGELLYTAEDKESIGGGRREVRRSIYAGMAADALDIGSIVYAVAAGHIGKTTGGLLGGAAVSAIGLGLVGLRGL